MLFITLSQLWCLTATSSCHHPLKQDQLQTDATPRKSFQTTTDHFATFQPRQLLGIFPFITQDVWIKPFVMGLHD